VTVRASTDDIEAALQEMSTMLEADGYELGVAISEGLVHLVVRAGPGACEDCLVPKDLFASMAMSTIAGADISIDASDLQVTYPADTH
jgi:hypothetical protein